MSIEKPVLISILTLCIGLYGCVSKPVEESTVFTTNSLQDQFKKINERILAAPTNAALFAERAVLQLRQDSTLAAVNDYKRAIALDSLNATYHIALGDLYFTKIKLAESETYLNNAMRLAPTDPEPKLKLAEMKLFQRKYQESMDLVNDALRLEQGRAKGYHLKGYIYQETGDTVKAISSFITASEQDPNYFDPLLQLALLHADKKDPLAMDYYNSALAIRPDNTGALYGKGMYAQEVGMDSIAIACYDRIKTLEPNNALPWYNTGFIKMVHQQENDAAREQFTKAIKIMPTYAQAYYNRGLAYEIDNVLDSAYIDFKKALALQPELTAAAEGLGRLQKKGVKVERN